MNKRIKENGITLIALVITMIVLLILVGVSIAMLTGNNGILTQAQNAKTKTEEAEEKEGVNLATTSAMIGKNGYQELNQSNLQDAIDNHFGNGKATVVSNGDGTFTVHFIDSKRDYNITSNGIEKGTDWNEVMASVVAPESQDEERNNGVIGIGTNGNSIDMDLWEYTKLDDGTYSVKYISQEHTDKGEIIGTVPQYIKTQSQNEFVPVTSMLEAFMNDTLLKIAPVIPNTITNMRGIFKGCTSLEIASAIPGNVTNLLAAFENCSILLEAPVLPDNAEDISWAFHGCTNLETAPVIPNKVKDMHATFNSCYNLINGSDIPESVEDITFVYFRCYKLSGEIKVGANVSGKNIDDYDYIDYYQCFYDAATDENANLTVKCSENVYNLFTINSSLVYSSNSHISLKQ